MPQDKLNPALVLQHYVKFVRQSSRAPHSPQAVHFRMSAHYKNHTALHNLEIFLGQKSESSADFLLSDEPLVSEDSGELIISADICWHKYVNTDDDDA